MGLVQKGCDTFEVRDGDWERSLNGTWLTITGRSFIVNTYGTHCVINMCDMPVRRVIWELKILDIRHVTLKARKTN